MNEYQSDLQDLQIKIEGKIREFFPKRTEQTREQTTANKLITFVTVQITNLIFKEDFKSVRDTVIISTENPKSKEEVKSRVNEIIGNENVSGIAELKNNRGEKSKFKINVSKQKTLVDNKKCFPIGKLFKELKGSNDKNKHDKIDIKPFIPKRFLSESVRINLMAKDIRQERKEYSLIKSEKILTKTHVNFRKQKLDLLLKLKGQSKYVELDQFEAIGFDKEKWLHKYRALKNESFKEILRSIEMDNKMRRESFITSSNNK